MCVYVLIAIVKKHHSLEASLYQILPILSLTIFEQTPLNQLLILAPSAAKDTESNNQLILFE